MHMTTTTLISMQTEALNDSQMSSDITFNSTCFADIHLSAQGETYVPSIKSFKTISKYINVKYLITSQYFGQAVDKPKLTLADVKSSAVVDLALLGFDAREALLKLVTKWIKEDSTEGQMRANNLVEKGLARISFKQTVEPVRKELLAIIAHYPEIVDVVKASKDFAHVDAIRYGAYIEGEMVELITVYSDRHIMYNDQKSNSIVASVSGGFSGTVSVPGKIRTTSQDNRLVVKNEQGNSKKRLA